MYNKLNLQSFSNLGTEVISCVSQVLYEGVITHCLVVLFNTVKEGSLTHRTAYPVCDVTQQKIT